MNSAIHVFKFGGASVKDAKAVLNIVDIIQKHDQSNLIVVVSAMGKTTNKLEAIFNSFIKKDKETYFKYTKELKIFHVDIIQGLFKGDSLNEINEIGGVDIEIQGDVDREDIKLATNILAPRIDELIDIKNGLSSGILGVMELIALVEVNDYLTIKKRRNNA